MNTLSLYLICLVINIIVTPKMISITFHEGRLPVLVEDFLLALVIAVIPVLNVVMAGAAILFCIVYVLVRVCNISSEWKFLHRPLYTFWRKE